MPDYLNKRYRSIFISDFHIGAKTFNARALLDFLKHNDCDTLYLVGDIIDGWKLKKRWYWNEIISQIFDELARKADEGTQIIYLPGNHDDEVRFIPVLKRMRFMHRIGIKICNSIVHKTADGRKFLVMHGDQFDTKILSEPVLKAHHKASDWLSTLWQKIYRERPYIEINGTMKQFSLAKHLSKHGRIAIQALNNFEGLVYKTVKSKRLDGVICGHTHIPVKKVIRDITYINTGSWLRSGNTAVVEDFDGTLSLLDWDDYMDRPQDSAQLSFDDTGYFPDTSIRLYPDAYRYRPVTDFLVKKIRHIWEPDSHNAVQPQIIHKPRGIKTRLQALQNQLGASISLPLQGTLAYDNTLQPEPMR